MSEKRVATDPIKGYRYQFNCSIEQILELESNADTIVIEGIEDIDVNTATETIAIQCKYYEKTEYNHSVVAKPIRLMLTHYKKLKDNNKPFINYMIYGKYKSGQEKLILPLDREYLIKYFLTYTKDKIKKYHHIELGLSENDLDNFTSLLKIDVNAKEYKEQYQFIINLLKECFACTEMEAEYCYYSNALKIIFNLAIKDKDSSRKISKYDFLKQIDKKEFLFNAWFIKLKGKKKYYKILKDQYFKSGLNTSPFERFFLIELLENNFNIADLKILILGIQKKWSKLSKREKQSFCPYIYIHGINNEDLVNVKTCLRDEGYFCIDGFDFCNAPYSAKSIVRQATYHNKIKLKILNKVEHINLAIAEISKTIEIYQFYLNSPYYQSVESNVKHIKIQIENLRDIEEILK